jgi:hypothetical protein
MACDTSKRADVMFENTVPKISAETWSLELQNSEEEGKKHE